jgi:Caspase domain/Sel1 repeat
MTNLIKICVKPALAIGTALLVFGCATQDLKTASVETTERVRIAAANMQDAVVIDCQLPGKLMMLGGTRQYLTPGQLERLTAIDCRTRGGEYTLGDLSGGTLSLNRWQPLAEQGNAEAQYYVARIYANGMGGVPADYSKAADWYQKAAKQKYPAAMQELGYLYESGLGVPQDKLLALNLQREASGLGDQLDYAYKLTAAKEDAAKQAAALSEQLEASNSQLESLRDQLGHARDRLSQSRRGLSQAESTVLGLRAQLQTAQSEGGGDGGARAKALEAKLAAKEAELTESRTSADNLRAEVSTQQTQLEAELQKSQAASLELNDVLGNKQDESKSLRARLAQSEQRFIKSQQELGDLRMDYRRQVDQLAAEREELEHAKAKSNNDAGAALLAAKEHDLALQTLRAQTLEAELAKLRQAQSGAAANAGKTAAQTQAQNVALRSDLAGLEQRYADQVKQLEAAKGELADLHSKTTAQRADLFTKLTGDLSARSAELAGKQHRIDSLESDASMLKGELARLRDQQAHDASANAGEAGRMRLALQASQQKISEQRDMLDQLRTDAAKERAALLAERANLQQQIAGGETADKREISALNAGISARQTLINAKDEQIAVLEKKIAERPVLTANNAVTPVTMRMPGPKLPVINAGVSANYYALVIGNSNYSHYNSLSTPTRDAQTIAALLEQQYGFKVTLLLDATSDKIMEALDRYSIDLKDSDRFLIYYAGHGGTLDGPPERAFWLGVDADPKKQLSWIPAYYVSDKIKTIKAKQILLVSDSCFSASITHTTTTTIRRETSEARFKVQWNLRARMVLTSGQNTPVADSSGDQNASLFAKYFISVLRQNDGLMSGETLAGEIASRMQPEATRMGIKQNPTYSSLQGSDHEYGEFFFLPPTTQLRVASLNE